MLSAPGHAPAMQSGSAPSIAPSQSSSMPLLQLPAAVLSAGGVQVPLQPQLPVQASVPIEPHVVVQDRVVPAQQVNPLSQPETQSSSAPLHTSAGAPHAPHPQLPLQVRVPEEPQVVVQLPVVPAQQVNPSSQMLLQLSSAPLQV